MQQGLNDHALARVGTEIKGKYRLERLIGSGGMASVYEAVHRNGNRVAIKILHPHLSIDADLRDRFLREGYVANKVGHRGAVRVTDDDVAEDRSVFLVMELLEGETLEARWQRNGSRLDQREVCQFALQLLEVLAAAHDQGIVHRDIKPENLFLTSDGVLKVLDFGIARLREASGNQTATRTGRMIGTPAFMPPEQVLGRSSQIDRQTDLWAVGATMFTLASGRYVHEAETMEEMLVFAGSRPAPPLATVLPGVSLAVASVIDRALAFAKEQRWRDAPTMRTALAEAYRVAYRASPPGDRRSAPAVVDSVALAPTAAASLRAVPPTFDDAPSREGHAIAAPAPEETVGSGTELSLTAWTPRRPPGGGISTTAGLARPDAGPVKEVPSSALRRGRTARLVLWTGLSAGVLGGGVAFFVLRSSGDAGAGTAVANSNGEPAAKMVSVPAPLPNAAEVPIAVIPRLAPDAGAAQAATREPARLPPAPPRPPVVSPAPVKPLVTVGTLPPPTPPTSKPNCDVPFYVDSRGIQRIRPECK